MEFDYEKPVLHICLNCHKEITGIRGVNGRTKIRCPNCGTVTISQTISRRHINMDIYAPKGQSII